MKDHIKQVKMNRMLDFAGSQNMLSSVWTKTSKYGFPVLLENSKRAGIAFFFEPEIHNLKSKIVSERGFRSGTKW